METKCNRSAPLTVRGARPACGGSEMELCLLGALPSAERRCGESEEGVASEKYRRLTV